MTDRKRLTVGELMATAKMKKGPGSRDIEGLCGMLRKIADDIEQGRAIEGDFNINIEELEMYSVLDLTLETYHLNPPKQKPKLIVTE